MQQRSSCWAFIAALEAKDTLSIISLSRHAIEQYPASSSRKKVLRGAYVFIEEPDADVTLIGVGAEMRFAVKTKNILSDSFGIIACIVSFPCQRLLKPSRWNKRQILQYCSKGPIIVIEAYAVNGWERYADARGSLSSFGNSLPEEVAYKRFGFDEEVIATKVAEFVENVKLVERVQGLDSSGTLEVY
jgi:dihydroxyacetone synthase